MSHRSFIPPPKALAFAAWALVAAGVATADDRDLLRDSEGNPYAFIILDTSGSMNWTTACSEADDALDIDPWDGMCTRECVLDPAVCQRFDPSGGCIEYNVQYDADNPPSDHELFIDTGDGTGSGTGDGTVAFAGSWTAAADGLFVGSQYLHDGNTGKGSKSVTFTPNIPETGLYHVYLFYAANASNAQNVPVTIQHAGGAEKVRVDQRRNSQEDPAIDLHPGVDPEHYNYIGTYRFSAGATGSVTVSNTNTDGRVVVDTVRLYAVSVPAGRSCVRAGYRFQQSLCPQGDCVARASADDPASKMFQAREALYQVLDEAPDVSFGFATYEQDQSRVQGKHWLYRVRQKKTDGTAQDFFTELAAAGGLSASEGTPKFPEPGSLWVFGLGPWIAYPATGYKPSAPEIGTGDGWNCVTTAATGADPEGRAGSIGCQEGRPLQVPPLYWTADSDDQWEMERARRIPKLGPDPTASPIDTLIWYRNRSDTANVNYPEGQVYKVIVSHGSGAYGDPTIAVDVKLAKCNGPGCSSSLSEVERRFYFDLVTDYLGWDDEMSRPPMRQASFFKDQATVFHSWDESIPRDGNDCQGLEPNDDTDASVSGPVTDPALAAGDDDVFPSPAGGSMPYTYKWQTQADARDPLLNLGDWVPLDWTDTHRELIMGRMAPNLFDPVTGDFNSGLGSPDFRTARFWNDGYLAGDDAADETKRKLRLKEPLQSALVPFGNTPLATSLDDFRVWYAGNGTSSGWSDLAAVADVRWECRNAYVLFLTDGNESCAGDPCTAAAELLAEEVKTYVVGFGVQQDCSDGLDNDGDLAVDAADSDCQGAASSILSETKLGCMAEEGGTESPILPRNKDELVEALQNIFSQIIPVPKTFASASVPALQSSAADKIYLSAFVPLPGEAVWPGRIDAFRRPLPLDAENRPDTARACGPTRQSGCHLWEAGEKLLSQAEINDAVVASLAVDDDVTQWSDALKIGGTTTSRRVFYPQADFTGVRPSELVLFRPPKTVFADAGTPDTADLMDLAEVLAPADLDAFMLSAITDKTLQRKVNERIYETLRPKDLGEAYVSFGGRPTYLLGDVFHSDPLVVTSPADFVYFSNDLCGRVQPEGIPNNCVAGEDRGYRRFTQEHVWRRQMLVAATNDGQLHFFDAGVLVEGEERLPDGQLREFKVFADGSGGELFAYMPRLTLPVVREQAAGSRHIYSLDGTLALRDVFIDPVTDDLGNVSAGERQWRTVIVAGLREGGDIFDSGRKISDFYGGYFALDITQPDRLDSDLLPEPRFVRPTPDDAINVTELKLPSCLDFDYGGDGHQKDALSCPQRFPMELWTFTDAVDNHLIGPGYLPGTPFLDEDANGVRDLGDTWSAPVIGQIAVCAPGALACNPDDPDDDDDLITKHVAIFGGGLDPDNKTVPGRGNWLYMVDIETGEAIYKRQLEGAAAAPPAVLDLDRDGIFDVIYQATTAGFVYKVDLDGRDAAGDLPDLAFEDVRDTDGTIHSNKFLRVDDFVGAGKPRGWDPYKILETANDIPIYFSPVAFFIPELGHYGLAVGAGERENLWEETFAPGRFYVIVDAGIPPPTADPDPRAAEACETRVPIEDACLTSIAWDADPAVVTMGLDELVQDNVLINDNPIDDKQGGWVMTFPDEFRMTSPPFLVSTILVFSQFQPQIFITGGAGSTATCASTGTTRSYVVQVQNANPVARLSAADQGTGGGTTPTTGALKAEDRYLETPEFTTAPFIDRTSSKNVPSTDGQTLLDLIEEEVENGVREAIMSTFPRGSRFNDAYQIAIAALRNSTGLSVYATIPVAIYPADWREP